MRFDARLRQVRSGWLIGVAVLLTACATSISASPEPVGEDPHEGHASMAAASHDVPRHPGADGTIVLENGFFAGGSGVGIDEAIRVASSQPVLVNGILLREVDGTIWLCEALDTSSPPSCEHPRLLVANFDGEETFDPANVGATGAESSGGVVWLVGHQLFGTVHP